MSKRNNDQDVDDDIESALSAPSTLPTYRPTIARAELNALREWEANGKRGKRPDTSTYDALVRKYENGGIELNENGTRVGKRQRADVTVTFTRNGKRLGQSFDKLSRIAFHYTNGLGTDGGRLNVDEFRVVLAQHGITSPESTTWEVEFDNGVTLGAIAHGDMEASDRADAVHAAKRTRKGKS